MPKLSSLRKEHSSALAELDMIECKYFGLVENLEVENCELKDNLLEARNLLKGMKEVSPETLLFIMNLDLLLKTHILCKKAGRTLSREELRVISEVA